MEKEKAAQAESKSISAQAKRLSSRITMVERLIDEMEILPNKTLRDKSDRSELVEHLAKNSISNKEDMRAYVSSLMDIKTTFPTRESVAAGIDRLAKLTDSLAVAKILNNQAHQWREKFLDDPSLDQQAIQERTSAYTSVFNALTGANSSRKIHLSPEGLQEHFKVACEVYEYIFARPSNLTKNSLNELSYAIGSGINCNNTEQTKNILDLYKKMPQTDAEVQEKFLDSVNSYSGRHIISDEAVTGFIGKLLPDFINKNPQIAGLIRGGNIYAMHFGEFGLGDLLVHCYALSVTPPHLNELLMEMRQVPGTTVSRLEQNRVDSEAVSGYLREIVHDERPYAHKLIRALVDYYDTGEKKPLATAFQEAREYEHGEYSLSFNGLIKQVSDKSFYDKEIIVNKNAEPEKRIDVLRRLLKNTEPEVETPPPVSDPALNKTIKALMDYDTSKLCLNDAFTSVNNKLEAMMQRHEIGIEPNTIFVLAWLGRKGTESLKALTFEDQLSAYGEPWFVSILKFQELTASPDSFNPKEFQRFIDQVQKSASMNEAYKLIAKRTLEHTSGLGKAYADEGMTDTGAFWPEILQIN